MKISSRISIFTFALVVVITAALCMVSLMFSSNIVRNQVQQSLMAQVDAGAALVGQNIEFQLKILQELADRARTRTMDWAVQQDSLLPDIDNHGYLDLAIVTPDGIAHYVKGNNTSALGDRAYVQSAFTGQPAISSVLISRVTNSPVVMLAVPIRVDDSVVGVLIARKDGNHLSQLIKNLGYGDSGYAYLVDAAGVVVAHPRSKLVLDQFTPIEAAKTDPTLQPLADTFAQIISGASDSREYFFNELDIIVGYTPVGVSGFFLAIAAEKREFQSGLNQLIWYISIASVICSIGGGVLAFLVSQRIARPIKRTSTVVESITKGDGDLTHVLPAHGKDELGELSGHINTFISSLHDMVVSIKKTGWQLKDVGADLAFNMTETSASITQITFNIDSMKQQILNQSAGVNETLSTVQQITNTIESFRQRIEEQATNVNQASASIEELVSSIHSVSATLDKNAANIENLLKVSNIGKEKISLVAQIIGKIGLAAEGMLEASVVISNIAAQTNLLSMNAAIEAAHAGDAGKGFAVVADEIRKLAENSNEQTKSISKVLGDIKGAIDQAVGLSNEAEASFDNMLAQVQLVNNQEQEIKNAMAEQSLGGTEVLTAVSGINRITAQIHDNSSEISISSITILDEMKRLTSVTTEISQSISEMSAGAQEIMQAMNNVADLSQTNKECIDALDSQVSRFKVRD